MKYWLLSKKKIWFIPARTANSRSVENAVTIQTEWLTDKQKNTSAEQMLCGCFVSPNPFVVKRVPQNAAPYGLYSLFIEFCFI